MTDETDKNQNPQSVASSDTFTSEERERLRELLRVEKEIQEVVRGKMITKAVINFIGETAKYVTALIAAVIAYRQFMGGK